MERQKYKIGNKGASTSNVCVLRATICSWNLDNKQRRSKSRFNYDVTDGSSTYDGTIVSPTKRSKTECGAARESLMEIVRIRKLKLSGHIARMRDERLLKVTTFGNVEGVRLRGRPPRRWTDDITDWCQAELHQVMLLAQDRNEWNMFMFRHVGFIAKR